MNQDMSRYLLIWKPGYLLTCDPVQVNLPVGLMNKRAYCKTIADLTFLGWNARISDDVRVQTFDSDSLLAVQNSYPMTILT